MYEGLALMILDTIFPQLAPFIAVGDSIYHAVHGDPAGLAGGLDLEVSIRGKKYDLSLKPK